MQFEVSCNWHQAWGHPAKAIGHREVRGGLSGACRAWVVFKIVCNTAEAVQETATERAKGSLQVNRAVSQEVTRVGQAVFTWLIQIQIWCLPAPVGYRRNATQGQWQHLP